MRRNPFMTGMQGFMAMHHQSVRMDREREAQRRADEAEAEMASARPSGRLGDSRLADAADVAKAGLYDRRGLFLGAFEGRPIFFAGDGPMLTYLRTGGGKGRDLLLPNMAHVRDRSLVIIDVKDGENQYASAEHRAATLGTRCIFLNPFGMRGVPDTPINPLQILLDIVNAGGSIDSEANEIAQILLPPPVKPGDDAWVRKGALRLLAMRMEYLALFEPELCSLSGLWRFVNADHHATSAAYAMMSSCGVEAIERKAGAFERTYAKAPKQYEAYKADAIEALESFEPGKAFERSTSAHTFDFSRLKHEPHSVYLMVPSDKIGVAAPWVSLVLNYAIETIAKEAGPLRTTFLLDEFPQLPPAPAIMKALRLYRGKGIQLWFFAQGRFSMAEKWSREAVKEFEDQAAVITMKNVKEPDLIRDLQLWSGNATVLMKAVSHSGGPVEVAGTNLGEQKRFVLQSENILGLQEDEHLLRVASMPRLLVAESVPFYEVEPWARQMRDVRDLHTGMK
ncbi:type IV secretory system conjugative DNA transfer family protein [Sphingobium yanoikuyae]|uniref:type IV secretory system conjugative DNA transfer family protein n=1 Tax=Sphingobium yanoikuyae TaxID=13690 RepID=UPI0009BE82CC|nr:type IV secretory system conjugative DNA transfer family protein [Sphingobium yanoikuyae]